MRTLVSLGLMAILVMPSLAAAQGRGILASAERITEGTELQRDVVDTRRSTGRVALGLTIAGAGAAMLLIDPKQPVQPSSVSKDTLIDEAAGFIAGPCGSNPVSCEFRSIVLGLEPDLRIFERRGVLGWCYCGGGCWDYSGDQRRTHRLYWSLAATQGTQRGPEVRGCGAGNCWRGHRRFLVTGSRDESAGRRSDTRRHQGRIVV